jgi:hypothetical protein
VRGDLCQHAIREPAAARKALPASRVTVKPWGWGSLWSACSGWVGVTDVQAFRDRYRTLGVELEQFL